MSVIRVVFLGTPQFAVPALKVLLKDEHFVVAAVVTQPDRPAGRNLKLQPSSVKVLAQEHGIPVLTPERINTPEVIETLKSYRAEAAVVVAFGQILKQEFFAIFPFGAVNVHASLLPRWRGAAPIQRALMAGDETTGVALQKMVLKLDAGDVLGVRSLSLSPTMDAIQVHDLLAELGADLLRIEFMDYLRGNLAGRPQDEQLVTYAPKIDKVEAKIDWSWSAEQIANQYRGLMLGPGVWSTLANRKVKLYGLQPLGNVDVRGQSPGEVLSIEENAIIVATGRGGLRISELQPESRKRQPVGDFLKGHKLQPGDCFGK